MNRSVPAASTLDLIAAVSSDLTPTQRRIAEAALAEPTLLAFGTVSDLAGRVGTGYPAPDNLPVPPYRFESDTVVVIGEEGGTA